MYNETTALEIYKGIHLLFFGCMIWDIEVRMEIRRYYLERKGLLRSERLKVLKESGMDEYIAIIRTQSKNQESLEQKILSILFSGISSCFNIHSER